MLGGGPAGLQHVDAGQDAQGEDVAAFRHLLDQEFGPDRAEDVAADRVDEGHRAIGIDAAVEDDHRQLLTGLLDGRGQGGRGVGRDDQHVAVLIEQVLNVRDLLVVVAFGVDMGELGDVLVQLNLGFHRRVADGPPRVVDARVREADIPGRLGRVLGGIDHLRLDHLDPRLVRRPFRFHGALPHLLVKLFLDEPRG